VRSRLLNSSLSLNVRWAAMASRALSLRSTED
jgi:hypothetical protein